MKTKSIRVSEETWKILREIAFKKNVSIKELVEKWVLKKRK